MSGKITQISLFSMLMCGKYDGIVSVRQMKSHGNMAIGTMDNLDGEMAMVDGVVYQARTDGKVRLPGDDETIPFGTIVDFHSEQSLAIRDVPSFEVLEKQINSSSFDRNYPLAIRISGHFPRMKVRTVGRQPNGVSLAKAVDGEVRLELADSDGDLIGFRMPGFVRGFNAPGWHLHYVDFSRQHGGHVVNFSVSAAEMQCCTCTDLRILLPENPDVLAGLDLDRDFSADLQKAEAAR